MKIKGLHLPPPIAAFVTKTSQRWEALPPRERLGLGLAGWIIGAGLIWVAGVQPALITLREAPTKIDALDVQLQAMQRMAAEVRELRTISPVSSAQAAQALKSATDRLGEKAKLSLLGDRAVLTLNGVTPEPIRAWLNEARIGARARPVEAQLARAAEGYSGTLTVTFAGGQ